MKKLVLILGVILLIGCNKDLVVGPGSGPGVVEKTFTTPFATGKLEGKHNSASSIRIYVEYTSVESRIVTIRVYTDLATYEQKVLLEKDEAIFSVDFNVNGLLTDIEIF